MKKPILILVAAFIAVFVTANMVSAQTTMVRPDPVNNPTWQLPCDHPDAIKLGFSCTPTRVDGGPDRGVETDYPSDEVCAKVNPYIDGETAVKCASKPLPPDAVPAFIPGRVYAFGYNSLRAKVLMVGQDVDGIQVVVMRKLYDDRELVVFRTPPTPGGSTNWFLVNE